MPSFVVRAVNRWSVEPLGAQRSVVRIQATLTLRGVARWLSWPMRWQLQAVGTRVAEELKYFVEHGRAHPRKQVTSGASVERDPLVALAIPLLFGAERREGPPASRQEAHAPGSV
jgi:hypothetical protein